MGDVEARRQRALGAVDLEVAHRSDRLPAADQPLLAHELGARLGQRQRLRRGDPGQPLQRAASAGARGRAPARRARPGGGSSSALDPDGQVHREPEQGLDSRRKRRSGTGDNLRHASPHCSPCGVRLRPCPPTASSPPSGPTPRRVRSTRACASSPPTSSTWTRRTTPTRSSSPRASSRTASSTASCPGCASTSGCSSSPRTTEPAAARARPVPGHLRQQPRRVLHGPGRRPQAPHRRRGRRPRGVRD